MVLVSYEPDGNANDPYLHVWNRNRWVPLSYADYQAGAFIKRQPSQTIVLGNDDRLTATLLNSAERWGPQTFSVPVTNARTIVNGLGQRFGFTIREWQWFADKYELELVEINKSEREEIWYDQPNKFKGGERPKLPIKRNQPAPQTYRTLPPNGLQNNPAVTKTTPTTAAPASAVTTTIPPVTTSTVSGRQITTLPSIEPTPAPAISTPAISSPAPAISSQAVADPAASDFKGWNKTQSVQPAPSK